MRVSQILPRKPADVVHVGPAATMRVAIELMKRHGVGSVLVLEHDHRLLGVLSERDVVHALASEAVNLLDRPVIGYVRNDGPTAAPDDTVQSVMEVMTATRARHVPVIQYGRVVGIVSIGDVVKSCLNERIQENAVLQEIARAQYFAN
jgi:CBS domain-containing protein